MIYVICVLYLIRALLVSLSDFNTPPANDLHWIGGSSRDPSDHHPSLMPRPTHALTLRCTVLFCVTLCYSMLHFVTLCCTMLLYVALCYSILHYVTLHFATRSLCSPSTAHFCTFRPFAKQWSALHCFALHHYEGFSVVITVWDGKALCSAQWMLSALYESKA